MQYLRTATALLVATVVVVVSANKRDLCADGSTDDNNNWYCQNVTAITYTGVGGSGSYNRVTSMDSNGGGCSSVAKGYSGTLSPLDEEVSLHFRGPLTLKKFAVYTPGGSLGSKRREAHVRRHVHGHGYGHQQVAREAEAAVGDMVTAVINGVAETWVNEWSGQSATPAPVAGSPSSGSLVPPANLPTPSSTSSSATASSSSTSSGSGNTAPSSGGWGRMAFYNASANSSEGLVFLNHNGGTGSGVFDYTYGNSLSYASSDGQNGAASPQILSDCTLPSSSEVVIMSSRKCGANNGACGYYRPGTVAHHGFAGPSKAFIFEFNMPSTGQTAASIYDPVDMPAIWMLNAQIPRTLQYGEAACSCWTSGCGEFDIFEVLAPGDKRAKSTLHGNIAGRDSDFFGRPEGTPIQVATVLHNDNIHIKILDREFNFGADLDAETVADILGTTMVQTNTVSLFALSG
ncbi:hypothetical protein LTR62_003658 [Meristemomyces frigidus]|uniref:glucan endo-1,3-beta-D-glucosidase n=1 Tax=Meristemomyces frigidus TaxID=1508187 RepID=A0AAN7THA1_9PEZI|nr:hypothetical protein LTR62_003658 [Meristemomyces frigidus]